MSGPRSMLGSDLISLRKQQFLYFLPLPHAHLSFLPCLTMTRHVDGLSTFETHDFFHNENDGLQALNPPTRCNLLSACGSAPEFGWPWFSSHGVASAMLSGRDPSCLVVHAEERLPEARKDDGTPETIQAMIFRVSSSQGLSKQSYSTNAESPR